MKALYNKMQTLPMKDMDGSLLAFAIMNEARAAGATNLDDLYESIAIASYLHRNDTRANRGGLPRDNYITHPLRNTLRLIRYYDITNSDILIAAVLHDTVEDHPNDIVIDLAGQDIEGLDEEEIRRLAMSFISGRFGAEVARIVLAVSNPINTGQQLTKDEKRAQYVAHVKEAIFNDYPVYLVKFADFYDNAGSLHHTLSTHGMTDHLIKKYTPLVDIFKSGLLTVENNMTDKGYFKFVHHLLSVQYRLEKLAKGETIS